MKKEKCYITSTSKNIGDSSPNRGNTIQIGTIPTIKRIASKQMLNYNNLNKPSMIKTKNNAGKQFTKLHEMMRCSIAGKNNPPVSLKKM